MLKSSWAKLIHSLHPIRSLLCLDNRDSSMNKGFPVSISYFMFTCFKLRHFPFHRIHNIDNNEKKSIQTKHEVEENYFFSLTWNSFHGFNRIFCVLKSRNSFTCPEEEEKKKLEFNLSHDKRISCRRPFDGSKWVKERNKNKRQEISRNCDNVDAMRKKKNRF